MHPRQKQERRTALHQVECWRCGCSSSTEGGYHDHQKSSVIIMIIRSHHHHHQKSSSEVIRSHHHHHQKSSGVIIINIIIIRIHHHFSVTHTHTHTHTHMNHTPTPAPHSALPPSAEALLHARPQLRLNDAVAQDASGRCEVAQPLPWNTGNTTRSLLLSLTHTHTQRMGSQQDHVCACGYICI